MKIEDMRMEIDKIDDDISDLFRKRMKIIEDVAEYKKESSKSVLDKRRESQILTRVLGDSDPKFRYYLKTLFSMIFSLSKSYQSAKMINDHSLSNLIREKAETTVDEFPEAAVVACQGIEGAYSQIACEKLFRFPNETFFDSFNAVFHAVEKGLCKYGVLPIENSLNGSVTQVYDLMKERNFYIVRSISLKVDHCLLAKPGTDIKDIDTIFSHEQAIAQCTEFLEDINESEIKICENTAVAAKMVAESDSGDVAAISSRDCAGLYGLEILKENIQNNDNNYTRFICISKDLEIYPGSDKMSIILTVPHRPGTLFELMSKFASTGLNLTKLESRPMRGRDFEFMFYFDFEASVYSEQALNLLDDLSVTLDQFKFLGSYTEK